VTCPVDVLVAVPAHDEQEGIGSCLSSVIDAVEAARRTGAVRRALVAVAAHNCQDATAVLAKQRLIRQQTAAFLVTEDLDSATVGAVRHELIDPNLHLRRGLLGERQAEDLRRPGASSRDDPRDPAGDHLGLARACAGNDQQRALAVGDRSELLRVQPTEKGIQAGRRITFRGERAICHEAIPDGDLLEGHGFTSRSRAAHRFTDRDWIRGHVPIIVRPRDTLAVRPRRTPDRGATVHPLTAWSEQQGRSGAPRSPPPKGRRPTGPPPRPWRTAACPSASGGCSR